MPMFVLLIRDFPKQQKKRKSAHVCIANAIPDVNVIFLLLSNDFR